MTTARRPLLGRDREIEVLEEVLTAALGGTAGFLVVAGEAGIGKSSLLQELTAMATELGCLTLAGNSSEYEHDLPFGLFTDALDAYLASMDTPALQRLAMDRLGAVAAVFPSMASIDQAVEYPTSATERFRVHRAVRELLERVATRRPLVLVLDDLHWSDDASLELISYLVRHPPDAEVLVAMALRPGQGDPNVIRMIDGIRNSTTVHDLEPAPLSLEDVRALVGKGAAELHRVSGGNPFYALQLARSGSTLPDIRTPETLDVPVTVARAILGELAGLSPGSRVLADAAAVVGDPFEIEVAAAAVGSAEDEVFDQLDELVWKDLVRVIEVPRRFRFRHPIVRSAIYSSCAPGTRLAYHRRVAEFLETRGAPAGERAYHVEQAAQRGDVEAARILRQAGDEAADRAPASSIRWFNGALRLLPEDSNERIGLLTSLASSMLVLGRISEAFEALTNAHLLAEGRGEVPVSLTLDCAQVETLLGRLDSAMSRLQTAYDALNDRTSPDAASLAIALASTGFQTGSYASSHEWGMRAALAAESPGNQALRAAALSAQAVGAAFAGEVVNGLEMSTAASQLVDSLPDDVIKTRLDALSNLTAAELYLDRYLDVVRHGERCADLARANRQTHVLPTLIAAMGTALWVVGDLRRSAAFLDDAVDAARLAGNTANLSWALFNRAGPELLLGNVEHALAFTTESVALSKELDPGLISAYAGVIHAMVLQEAGESAAAIAHMIESAGGEDLPLLPGAWRPFYIEILVRCHLALGDPIRAADTAAWARREAESFAMDMPLLMADRAEAEVALSDNRPDDAFRLAMSAIRRSEAIGSRTHAAISRALAGRALARFSQGEAAVELLSNAASEFDELGMARHRDQTESELRALGHTVHRRSRAGTARTGIEALTGREREVADLVVDRRTNREIAEHLFLSTKTVETHMRNIFNKLGVSSRVEVARAITAQSVGDAT